MINNRTYVIINISEINDLNYSKLLNNNASELPQNIDGSKAIIKYVGDKPSFLSGKTTYTAQELYVEKAKSEWKHEIE
tara:strand:+ start:1352 stop:1585 length:234 start_codon:yes stop_codon:yes gene_type:complete